MIESSKPDALTVDQDGGVLTLTNNDAPRNRMTLEYMDAVEAAVGAAAVDATVRVLVFTAAGDEHFSVGMDLKQLMAGTQDRGGFEGVLDQRRRVLTTIETLGKPSIATLYGYCLGGGLELPLACHFRFAADEGARIGLPELDLGTVPAWGGTARLVRCVGRDQALDMILRAKKIDGPRALDIGLVQEVHPIAELKEAAASLARELAAMPPVAVASVLDCVVGYEFSSLDDALDAERRAVRACSGTTDQIEGMQAFLEKRRPVFTGR
ncbi:MAG: enoyl-CoA hydratase-related protein [Acidimicrobiia bacterium]|nr:enoyl-CoA hydratase-related protein [Acidimicrobiia bacterium]